MIKREILETKLSSIFNKLASKRKMLSELQEYLLDKHGMNPMSSGRFINGIVDMKLASTEIMYWFLDGVNTINEKYDLNCDVVDIREHFSEKEIASYKNSAEIKEDVEVFPIVFDNVKRVNDDQWVTVVDTNFLKKLYDNQVVNYNFRTQRNAKYKTVNNVEVPLINIKQKSIDEICALLRNERYISNDITLNLNMDREDLVYDTSDDRVVLEKGQFDIIDGYHRFRAIMLCKSEDADFNYNFIINIMNFDENKACNYIAQQDKRNKINSKFSVTMDDTKYSNVAIKRLQEDTSFYLYDKISRNKRQAGILTYDLYTNIDKNYNPKVSSDLMKIKKEIKETFNNLINYDERYLTSDYDFADISLIVRAACKHIDTETLAYALKNKNKMNKNIVRQRSCTKRLIDEVDELLGVSEDV